MMGALRICRSHNMQRSTSRLRISDPIQTPLLRAPPPSCIRRRTLLTSAPPPPPSDVVLDPPPPPRTTIVAPATAPPNDVAMAESAAVDDNEMEQEDMFVEAHESFAHQQREWGGPRRGGRLPEPTRFGDWERKGRCSDF